MDEGLQSLEERCQAGCGERNTATGKKSRRKVASIPQHCDEARGHEVACFKPSFSHDCRKHDRYDCTAKQENDMTSALP